MQTRTATSDAAPTCADAVRTEPSADTCVQNRRLQKPIVVSAIFPSRPLSYLDLLQGNDGAGTPVDRLVDSTVGTFA